MSSSVLAQQTSSVCVQGTNVFGVSSCTPVSSTSPLPIGVYDSGNHSGYVLTSNGSSSPATFQAGGGGGSGTVTSVSVVTANGISGSVANATTTPAVTLTLGAITPSSVASTGAVSGTTGSFSSTLGVTGAATFTVAPTISAFSTAGVLTNNASGVLASTTALSVAYLNGGSGASSSTFWRGDGTWATPAGGSGTVTSVGVASANGVTASGSPVTTSGNITLAPTVGGSFAASNNNLGFFAATTSAQLAGVLSDETGTGFAVFSASPTFTGTVGGAAATWTGADTALNFVASGSGANTLPVGTTGQRPGSPVNGMIRYNSTTPSVEAYVNNAWTSLGSGGSSVSVTAATPNIVVTPSPGTGTFTVGATNPINYQTGTSYTFASTDNTQTVLQNNASASAYTLPVATTSGFTSGFATFFFNKGAGTATITPTTSTINGAASLAVPSNQGAFIFSDSTNNYEAFTSSSGSVTWPSTNSLVLSNSTNSPAGVSMNCNGCIPIGSSGGVPIGTTLTAGSNITITNAANGITIAASSPASTNLGTSTSATSPQISGDATTGFYTPSAAVVAASISGTQKMAIGSSTITFPGVYSLAFGSYNIINSTAFGNLSIGASGSASIVLNYNTVTLGPNNSVATDTYLKGTDVNFSSNTAAGNLTISGEAGTGTGAGGPIIFRTAPAGSSSSSTNSQVIQMEILGTGGVAVGTHLTFSGTAPTITSGFGTSPTVASNSTATSMDITVGTSPGSSGVLALPTATTEWNCDAQDVTTPSNIKMTAHSTTSATFTSYGLTTGIATNFTASDDIAIVCAAH